MKKPPKSVGTARKRFRSDTKRAVKRSFHPRELLIPSEKLEGMTAQAIYSGVQLVRAKRRSKKR